MFTKICIQRFYDINSKIKFIESVHEKFENIPFTFLLNAELIKEVQKNNVYLYRLMIPTSAFLNRGDKRMNNNFIILIPILTLLLLAFIAFMLLFTSKLNFDGKKREYFRIKEELKLYENDIDEGFVKNILYPSPRYIRRNTLFNRLNDLSVKRLGNDTYQYFDYDKSFFYNINYKKFIIDFIKASLPILIIGGIFLGFCIVLRDPYFSLNIYEREYAISHNWTKEDITKYLDKKNEYIKINNLNKINDILNRKE